MYLLFAFTYLHITLHIPPRIPFSNSNNIFTSVSNSNVTPVFFKHDYHDRPGGDK